uniref:Doublesex- and mab-3-related transcription factor C1/C2 C-terminal domain-containing protein n=1 Tax=Macaca fascicularis TaxID=9541 RepID=A0A7N9D8J8_MACFA
MAAPPKAPIRVRNLTIRAGVLTGRENNMLQPETHIFTASEEGSSQGALLLGQAPESLSLPRTPVTLEQQLVSPSGDPHRPPALPSICSTLILQPCATLDPLLLQPQVLGKQWGPEPWEGWSLVDGKSRRPWWGWGRRLREHGAEGALVVLGRGVVSQCLFSHALSFAGPQSL